MYLVNLSALSSCPAPPTPPLSLATVHHAILTTHEPAVTKIKCQSQLISPVVLPFSRNVIYSSCLQYARVQHRPTPPLRPATLHYAPLATHETRVRQIETKFTSLSNLMQPPSMLGRRPFTPHHSYVFCLISYFFRSPPFC